MYITESYVYFRWLFVEVLCHSFNFVNMRFVAKVVFFWNLFFINNFFKKIYFHKSLLHNFVYLLLHMFLWMNKFLFTENNFLPRLMNRKVTGLCIVSSKVFMP